jgi:pyrrolidone-carboxylate peptidase
LDELGLAGTATAGRTPDYFRHVAEILDRVIRDIDPEVSLDIGAAVSRAD